MFGVAFAIGTAIANLASPFGWWDFGVMPIVDLISCLAAWYLRRWPVMALLVQSAIIALGVAVFPLGMMLHTPILNTAAAVFVPQATILLVSWALIVR
jgi:hypothetical protein